MPFSQVPPSYYDQIYKPAIEAAGLKAVRADDIYLPSLIIRDIWREVRNARVLLADLTFRNPNVMYELGLAHAVGKPVVMLTQSLEDAPFDIRSHRIVQYRPLEPAWGATLEKDIAKALKEVLKSPTHWVLPAFLQDREIKDQPVVSIEEKRIAQLEQSVRRLESRTDPFAFPITAWSQQRGLTVSPSSSGVVFSGMSDPVNAQWLNPLGITSKTPLALSTTTDLAAKKPST